jgi:hypothetical protein
VTVFEKASVPGGAFRLAGKAPLFQEVAANEASFSKYIEALVAACLRHGVQFKFGTDVSAEPALLEPFDRIVVATGANYRLGLGPLITTALHCGASRWPGIARLLSNPAVRDWFYYKVRHATAQRFVRLGRPGQTVLVIGDAASPGKSKAAIARAFEAALLPKPHAPADIRPRSIPAD